MQRTLGGLGDPLALLVPNIDRSVFHGQDGFDRLNHTANGACLAWVSLSRKAPKSFDSLA